MLSPSYLANLNCFSESVDVGGIQPTNWTAQGDGGTEENKPPFVDRVD